MLPDVIVFSVTESSRESLDGSRCLAYEVMLSL
jgi:hypothetical protein